MSLTTILIIAGVIAIIALIVGLVVSIRGEKSEVEERLGRYAGVEEPVVEEKKKEKQAGALTDWINRSVQRSSFGERISKELARADLKFKPGEYLALIIIMGFVGALLLWFIGGRSILTGLIGAIIGGFLPRFYVKRQQGKRLQKFNEQLPDMLNLMVNGLRAGYSTMQAMEAVSKELPPPVCDEFKRVVQEMQLGLTMEKALENLVRRIPSDDLDLCVTAMNVQREVGGNLAEILDGISYTIRERVRIKGEIRVLTSQQSLSGTILGFMPVAVIGLLYLINRSYINEFFSKESNSGFPCGYCALIAAGTLIITGIFVMRKIGKIEV
jgi:tight adherence protein B